VHENHRERMRNRYYVSGFDSFSDHEILEMILYHSIPRGDTNELAHRLIEHFGDFNHVIEAKPDELKNVKGIGESSAMLIKLVEAAVRIYATSFVEVEAQYDTVKKIADFMWPRFFGLDHERLYMLMFNNKMGMIDCVPIADGTVSSASVQTRPIIEKALGKKASSIVLAHNHPHGIAFPSDSDVALTMKLYDGLSLMDIPLLEHLVIAENRFTPIIKTRCGISQKVSGDSVLMGANGFDVEHFYDVDEETYRFEPIYNKITGEKG